jgi:hypothetical protein
VVVDEGTFLEGASHLLMSLLHFLRRETMNVCVRLLLRVR